MPQTRQFELRQPVPPYVCSTPGDFNEERDFLATVIFPQLNELCRLRGSYLDPVDLRWAPDDTKSQTGLLLKTQLDAIKKSSPFFIGLLGETYGPHRDENGPKLPKLRGHDIQECDWLDKNLLLAGSGGHPWVTHEGHQASSITELEVTLAAFLLDTTYVTFYYRQADHLDDKLAKLSETGTDEEKQQLIQTFSPDSEHTKEKIHDLRQRIVKKGVPVKYFRTLEELGQHVLDDWGEIIDIVLPPLLHDVALLDTLEYREWLAQQSFIASRADIFVTTPDIDETLECMTMFADMCSRGDNIREIEELLNPPPGNTAAGKVRGYSATAWIKKQYEPAPPKITNILMLAGDRGVGKSTLAARWAQKFKDDCGDICVISHFVSASSGSADITVFLKQCIRQLRQRYLLSDAPGADGIISEMENSVEAGSEEFRHLCEAFLASIGLGPCVIVLDGLNELGASHGLTMHQVKEFSWLPEVLPSTFKMIVTTLRSDISFWNVSQRSDVTLLDLPKSLTDVNTTLAMLKEHQPEISLLLGGESTVNKLSNLKLMQTSLGSKIIGSELTCYRTYRNFAGFLESNCEVWSLRDFWVSLVQSWIMEHSWQVETPGSELNFIESGFDYSGWVMDALCLLAVSRNGLTQIQILSILRNMGYEDNLEVTTYDWHQFRLSAGATLREKADGRLVYGFKYLQEVAEYLFFKNMSKPSYDAVSILRAPPTPMRQAFHGHLASFFTQQPLSTQVMEELPWQLLMSMNFNGLVDFLTDCGALLKMLTGDSELWHQDLALYWSVCELKGQSPAKVYLHLSHALGVVDVNDMQEFDDTALSPMESGSPVSPTPRVIVSTPQPSCHDGEDREDYMGSPLSYNEEVEKVTGAKTPDPGEREFQTGVFLTHGGQTSTSATQSTLGVDRDNFDGVVSLVWNIAHFLQDIGQKEIARFLYLSLVKYFKQNYPLTMQQLILLCRCHISAGQLWERAGQPTSAEREFKLALHVLVDADDMDEELIMQNEIQYLKGLLLSCHGRLQTLEDKGAQLFESEELLKEALECVEEQANCFVLRSTIHYNLGLLRAAQGDYLRAELCFQEAGRLRYQWFGRSHPLVAEVFIALGKLLANPDNVKGYDVLHAETLLRQALTVREKCFGSNHPEVASVLFDLGHLLSEEANHPAKVEAQKLLGQALDIRTTSLGANHPLTMTTQQALTKLDVALKLGHYEFGSGKPSDQRSRNLPFSALTFRESDLSRLNSRLSSHGKVRLEDPISVRGVSREEVMRHNRPDSIISSVMSLTSASERLLSAPISDRPRLLHRDQRAQHSPLPHYGDQGQQEELIVIGGVDSRGRRMGDEHSQADTISHHGGTGSSHMGTHQSEHDQFTRDFVEHTDGYNPATPRYDGEDSSQVIKVDVQARDSSEGDNFPDTPRLDSYAMVGNGSPPVQKETKEKKTVTLRPSSAPRRIFQKYSGPRSETTLSRSEGRRLTGSSSAHSSRRMWSGRSNTTGTSSLGHQSRCSIPGRHDIDLSTTHSITGPHSSLTSLLDERPCPHPPSSNIHHRSAWYHIPGRYATPQERVPRKRMQKTENAKDIETFMALKSDWVKKQERNLMKSKMKELQAEGQVPVDKNSTMNLQRGPSLPAPPRGTTYSRQSIRHFHKTSNTPRLMISGLDMVPEIRYPEEVRMAAQQHTVKFKEPIVVG